MQDGTQDNNTSNDSVPSEQPGETFAPDATPRPQADTPQVKPENTLTTPSPAPAAPSSDPATPMSNPATSADTASASGKKNKTLIWCLIAVVAVAVIIAVVLVLTLSSGGQLSVEDVKKYCDNNGFATSIVHEDDQDVDILTCTASSDSNGDISQIQYAVANQPIAEMEEFDESINSAFSYFGASVLIDAGNYKKIYINIFGQSAYMIIKGNTYIMIAGTNDAAKNTLIALGYPDDEWGSDTSSSSIWDDWLDDADVDITEEDATSALSRTQRDTQRREDIAKVVTAITSYQTNNRGSLPEGPSYWEGSETIACADSELACTIVRDYLSSNSTSNTFNDPDDHPYSMYITENWVSNGSITPKSDNSFSYLVETSDGYTIDGLLPFDEYVIYIVPGGQCGTDGSVVKSQSARDFAALYMLEMESVYCVDNS